MWFSRVLSLLASDRANNPLRSSTWVQLATADASNTPHVRTVVYRGYAKSNDANAPFILFCTDLYSMKVNHLETNPNVEVCWLFLADRVQVRIKGTMGMVGDTLTNSIVGETVYWESERQKVWDKLPDASKQPFFDTRLPGMEKTSQKRAEKNGYDRFVLLILKPEQVDLVELRNEGNKRFVYSSPSWLQQELNP